MGHRVGILSPFLYSIDSLSVERHVTSTIRAIVSGGREVAGPVCTDGLLDAGSVPVKPVALESFTVGLAVEPGWLCDG